MSRLSRNDKYLYMGGPLLAGVTVVALSSLAPMALPLGLRSLAIAESISLYGGLAVFSGFVLYEYVFHCSFSVEQSLTLL
jgi:growth hormone-inducible transmembrane protein